MPANGDLLLGVRVVEPADPNDPPLPESAFTYIVNIGNDLVFRNAAPDSTLPLNGLGNLGSDLTALYGANWHQRDDLRWSIVGARNTVNPPLYASRPQIPFGTEATPFPALFLQARTVTKNNIFSVIDSYLTLPHTANSTKAAVQQNASNTGSYKWQVVDSVGVFGSLSQWTGIEGGDAGGIVNTALDLFRVAGNSTDGETVSRVGVFTIDNTGLITFTAPPLINAVRVEKITYNVLETDPSVTIKFKRLGDLSGASGAVYAITGGTAQAGVDYTAPGDFNLSFAATQEFAEVTIPVLNRPGFFLPRTFTATLVSATGGFVLQDPVSTTVTITDTDPDPGALSFPGPVIAASTSNSSVNVIVQRTAATNGAVAVEVSATGGTLVEGVDYDLPAPVIVSFADGVNSGSFLLPLSANAAGTIELTLSNPTNGSRLGSRTTTIIEVAGAVGSFSWGVSQTSALRESGAANLVIHRTGGTIGPASVVVNTTNGTAGAADFTPVVNQAVNFADGQDEATVPVTLTAPRPNQPNRTFTATLSNPGGGATVIAPSTITVVIIEADTANPSVTIATPRANAKILESSGPGVIVTGTAKDNKGVAKVEVSLNGGPFVEADITPTGSTATYNIAVTAVRGINTLVVRSVDFRGNASKEVIRSFIYDDPFPGVAGKYTGLVTASGATDPAQTTEGLITVTTTAKGAFSVVVNIDGSALRAKGTIDNDGAALFTVGKNKTPTVELAAKNKPTRTLALNIDLAKTGNTHKATGTLTEGANTSAIDADRALFTNKKNPVAPLVNPPAGLIGKPYTALFDALPPDTDGRPAKNLFPQGDGVATITVSNAGVAKVKGTLADGTAFTYSAPVSLAGNLPFYVALYKKLGSISGPIKFEDLAGTDVDGEALYWFRPADTKSKVYPLGWPLGVTTDFIGSKFDKAVKNAPNSVIPGLNHTNPAAANAVLTFFEGRLTGEVSKEVNVAANNKAVNIPATDKSYKLAVAGATGLLTGNFTHEDGKKPAFRGAVLQKSGRTSGFFLSVYNKTGPVTSESGAFTLAPPP